MELLNRPAKSTKLQIKMKTVLKFMPQCPTYSLVVAKADLSHVSRSWATKYEPGFVFRGSNTILHGEIRSVGQCQAACVSTPGCISFITTPSSSGNFTCEINDDEDTSVVTDANASCYLFEPYWSVIPYRNSHRWFLYVFSQFIIVVLSTCYLG